MACIWYDIGEAGETSMFGFCFKTLLNRVLGSQSFLRALVSLLPILILTLLFGCNPANEKQKINLVKGGLLKPDEIKAKLDGNLLSWSNPFFESSGEIGAAEALGFFDKFPNSYCRKTADPSSGKSLPTVFSQLTSSLMDPAIRFDFILGSDKKILSLNSGTTHQRHQKLRLLMSDKSTLDFDAVFEETLTAISSDQNYELRRKILQTTNLSLSDLEKASSETINFEVLRNSPVLSQIKSQISKNFELVSEHQENLRTFFDAIDAELVVQAKCTTQRGHTSKSNGQYAKKFYRGFYKDHDSTKWNSVMEIIPETAVITCPGKKPQQVVNLAINIYTRDIQGFFESCEPYQLLKYNSQIEISSNQVLSEAYQSLHQLKAK